MNNEESFCHLGDSQQQDRRPNSPTFEEIDSPTSACRKNVTIDTDKNLVHGSRPQLSTRTEFSSNGRRSLVTSMRLQRQGFVGRVRSSDFALKSIRRGSAEWRATLRPFVADIAFESIIQRRYQSETISFRPFTCYAAVLFVDLSNYSAITAAIASRGAHALSSVVNDYLSRILEVVSKYGGDVIKFAGDAVVIVWYSVAQSDLPIVTLTAAKCVLEMQKKAGEHPVDGTSLQFRIHCGLSCGLLESEVFSAPNHVNMQRLFHSVGGDALVELSELVDLAKAGEVCISNGVAAYLGSKAVYRECNDTHGNSYKLLTALFCDVGDMDIMDVHVLESLERRQRMRQRSMEEEFIHPTVIKLLSHGGLSPMQISQMRNLCVLFIAMTSSIGSSVNWLMEVQAILDKHRCPIVQIIDDDKGVHLIAAVNLSESIPECSLLGLEICRELSAKQVGCAVGMASGSTFCGVVGSSDIACRWDIAGPTPVRAARLMQYALLSHTPLIAIDQSVYNDPMSFTRMKLFDSSVTIKGTAGQIPVYTLSESESSVAFRVLETVHARVHDDLVDIITSHICIDRPRVAVVVTGVSLSGKKIICQRAAGCANLVPYLHLSDVSAGFLQLAKTIATWFRYVDDHSVNQLAENVLDLIRKQHWSRSHDECIDLVDLALSKGFHGCFLVDRIQFLDDFSFSIIRECLTVSEKRSIRPASLRTSGESRRSSPGKLCFLCVHVSLYNCKTVNEVVEAVSRLNDAYGVPVVRVGEATKEDLRRMFRDLSDMEVEDRWLDAYSEASGYSAGYFIERAAAIRALSGKLWSEGKRPYAETTDKLVLHIPYGLLRKNKTLPVSLVSAEHTMRFNQIFDDLPPLFQTTLKVLAIASRNGFAYKLPRSVLWEVLNDLIADGVEMNVLEIIISELVDMCIVKVEKNHDSKFLSFQSPAFADIAYDVSTPVQIQSIADALAERLQPHLTDNFKVPLVMACLLCLLGRTDPKPFWRDGYRMLLVESSSWSEKEFIKWKECIDDEISSAGSISADILENFSLETPPTKIVGKILPLLKIYTAPVAFGPMGHTLSVITRNTFHELGSFHGAYDSDTVMALYDSTKSAALRYLREMDTIETYLAENGLPRSEDELKEERDMIQYISNPALSEEDVQSKAATVLDTFVPRFVQSRLNRLHSLVAFLHVGKIPEILLKGDKAILLAYQALRADKSTTDAVQDALVIMATMNWKPKPVPEYLPLLHYQTVARLRNKVLKRLSEAEMFMFKHQQNHLDLEAFLIITALLSPPKEENR